MKFREIIVLDLALGMLTGAGDRVALVALALFVLVSIARSLMPTNERASIPR